jgi:hypothetical protein
MQKCRWCGRPYEGGLSQSVNPFGGYCSDKCRSEGGVQQHANATGEALAIAALFAIAVALALFLAPALLVIWPFKGNFGDAFYAALNSMWAWLGSAAFWGVVGFVIYKNRRKKSAVGRTFNCFDCGNLVQEPAYGLLDNGAVICPFCQGHNVSVAQ